MNNEVKRQLNNLAGSPNSSITMEAGLLREMLLETGGTLLACGSLYEFRSSHIGAGVCKVWLELWYKPQPQLQAQAPRSREYSKEDEVKAALEAFNKVRIEIGGIKTETQQRVAMNEALDAAERVRNGQTNSAGS
jgi:hypothetical protein